MVDNDEDEATQMAKQLLRVQQNPVMLPGQTSEHFDIYLAKEIYPCLVPGIEELSREIDRLQTSEGIDESILQRFNPAIYLAEYLMRNNPNHGADLEFHDVFLRQARIEKIRRFFVSNKTKIYKHFCIQDYKNNFSKKFLKEYFQALDGFLQMNGKLMANFDFN